jgi:hypothetical protein
MNRKVNNLSLDAIFAQRGIEVDKKTLKEGEVYLFDQKGRFDWDWIGRISKEKSPIFDIWFDDPHIASNGNVYHYYGGIDSCEVTAVYKATPDQIDLLNSCKQEEEEHSDLRKKIEAAIPTEIRGVNCPHRMVPVFTTKHAREYVIDAVVMAVSG